MDTHKQKGLVKLSIKKASIWLLISCELVIRKKLQSVPHKKLDHVNGPKLRYEGQIKNLRRINHFEKYD